MKLSRLLLVLVIATMLLSFNDTKAQTTATIGTATTSDYFFGPIYRSNQSSTFDYSRYHYLFRASELAAAGITPGSIITSLAFYKATTGNIDESGDAFFNIYMNNTANTTLLSSGDWFNLTGNSTLAGAYTFNTSNNLPNSTGWMTLTFTTPFVYTGGSLELSTDWDIDGISNSSPTSNAFEWRYDTYASGTSLGRASNNSFITNTLEDANYGGTERPNTRFTFTTPSCSGANNFSATNITSTTANLSWSTVSGASSYDWIVVPLGADATATPILSGTTSNTSVALTGLSVISSYDFYVQTDCGGSTSILSGPYSFSTLCNGLLNGNYTIGSTGADFLNIQAAVNALNTCGINGPVTFNIAAGTYDEAINLASINGLNAINTITFDGGNAALTKITHDGLGQRATIELNGADYITFQNITIEVNGQNGWGIHLWNSANYNTIDNCILNITASSGSQPIGVIATNSTSSITAAGNNANYTTISNSTFIGGYANVMLTGNSSAAADNTNNTVINCNFSNVSTYGIYLNFQDNPIITGNTMDGTSSSVSRGIYVENSRHGSFERNTISGMRFNGIYLSNINSAGQAPTQRTSIANNMLSTLGFGNPLICLNVKDFDVFYNSMLSENGRTFRTSSQSTNYNIRNNIFTKQMGNEVVEIDSLSPVPGAIDYNVYYHFGGGSISKVLSESSVPFTYTSTLYATLASWQAGNPHQNMNSISGNPNFFSPTDLHVQDTIANNVGIPITGFTTDIDGDNRSATMPDIGADEFTPTSCVSPLLYSLTATNLSFSSATLGWTTSGTETAWDIEWGLTGFTQGNGTLITATTTNPHVLTNLTAQTSYEFYVRADCGSSTSVWVGPYSFYTGYCLPTPSSVHGLGITNVTMNNVNNTTGAEPNNYGDYTTQVVNAPQALALSIDITLETNHAYSMWVWVDWNDDLDFDDANEANYLGESFAVNPYLFTGTLNVPANASLGNHRMRIGGRDASTTAPSFQPCDNSSNTTFEDYTINVTPAPNCLPISNAVVTTLATSSVGLSWTVGNNNSTSWNVEYGISGFNQGSGTTVIATTNPYTLQNLSSNTTYDVYIQSNCNGTTTTWTGPLTFTTACTNTVPYFEGFELGYVSNSKIENCLTQENVSGTNHWRGNTTTTNIPIYSGTWSAYLGYTNEDWLFIPIELTAGTSYTFGCFAKQGSSTLANANLAVHFGTLNTASAMIDTIIPTTAIVNGNFQELVGEFTPMTTTTYYIGIKGYVSTVLGRYLAIDNVSIIATPSCPAPSAVMNINSTLTSTDIAWTENGTATSWEIEYGNSGFTQGSGTTISVTSNPHTITNLTPNTNYDFYVRAVCSVNDKSTWTNAYPFFSGYCTPAPSSVDNQGITNISMGSINNSTGAEPGNYGNYTSMSTNVYQNSSLDLQITYQTSYTYDTWAWIDWNKDLDFDDVGEEYFLGTSTNANPTVLNATGLITIPTTAALGSYRIRIGGADSGLGSSSPSNPCYTGPYAAFEDYTLNVIAIPTCLTPSNLTTSNATATTIDLAWTENGTATSWNIEYGMAGFAQGSGTLVNVTTNPFTLSGLPPNSNLTYSFYVQSDCNLSNSSWSASTNFTTPCGAYSVPFYESFENGFTDNTLVGNCLTQENVVGSSGWIAKEITSFYNNSARTGDWNVYLDQNNEDWLFLPIILENGKTYDFECFARQTATIPNYGRIEVSYGLSNTVSAMTNTIISTMSLTDSYQVINGTITPSTTGTYYIGIRGKSISPTAFVSVDDITVTESTICQSPTSLNVTNILGTSANLSWIENGAATSWNIEYGAGGFLQGTGTTIAVTSNPYNLTGLSPTTTYSFYVQSDCGGTTSPWFGPYQFTTNCISYTVPYFEGFENGYANGLPVDGCLTQQNLANSDFWIANNTVTADSRGPRTGNWNTYLDWGNQTWLFIPMDLVSGVSYTFECYARHNNLGNNPDLRVFYGTSAVDSAMTTAIIPFANVANTNYQSYFGTFTPSSSGTFYIGIRGNSFNQISYISIDDISITATPLCPTPVVLTAANITSTTADLSWTETGSATNWEIEYGIAGFTQGTGTVVSATSNPFNLTGLTADTDYDYYVRAICGNININWSQPHTFSTPCVYSIPYFEGFENGYAHDVIISGCISQEDVNGVEAWRGNTNFTTFNRTPLNGNWNATLSLTNEDWLFIPVELVGGTAYTFDAYARQDDRYIAEADIKVSYGTLGAASAMTNTIVPTTGLLNGNYQQITGIFTPVVSGVYYIGIKGRINNVYAIALDDISVVVTPSCPFPVALTASNVLATSADLSWVETGTATNWEVEYGLAGFTLGTGTTITTTATAHTLTALTADTNYDVYVRSVCSAGDTSAWSWVESIFTGYCTPLPNFTVGQGIINVSMGSINNTTGSEPNSYGYYTSMITNIPQGGLLPITVTFGNQLAHETWVWVDWNNDLDFDDVGETYYLGLATNASPTTASITNSISVPINALVANHRIRIGGTQGMGVMPEFDPCYPDDTNGTFEDYTLGVLFTAPDNVGITAITGNCAVAGSVTVEVENYGTVTQNSMNLSYQLNNGTVVTEAWNGNIAAGATATYTFNNTFNAATTSYPYEIKAWTTLVGDTDFANDTLVETITTDTVFNITYIEDFETASITNWNSTGSFGTVYNYASTVAYENLYSSGATTFKLISPKIGIVGVGDVLKLKYRYVSLSIPQSAITLGNGDVLKIGVSTDCGNTVTILGQINSSNHTPTMLMTDLEYDISAFAGQNITIVVEANHGTGSYYISLDDFFVGAPFQQSVTSTNITCAGNMDGTATITASGGLFPYTYSWSNGQTDSTIIGLDMGSYTYTITDVLGSTFTDMITIIEPEAIVVTTSVNTNVSCNGFSDGSVNALASGGVIPLTYLWNTNDTLTTLTGISAGNYTVTVTDEGGCTESSSITVVEPAPLVINFSSIPDTAGLGIGVGSVTALVTGGTSPYIYSWDGMIGVDSLFGLTTGTYQLMVTDFNNCTKVDSIFVDEIVTTSNIEYLTNLSITPNPTNGNLIIDLELSQNADVSMSIYTITGVLVQEFSQENTAQKRELIDLSNQSNGLYLVRFVIDNQVVTRKLILNK